MNITVISFLDIYEKAIGLFDDPKITIAYKSNLAQFCKLMYTFLQTSVSLFNNPLAIVEYISNYEEPSGLMEVFEADGVSSSFLLDPDFPIRNNSVYTYIADGQYVEGTLDEQTRMVSFPVVLEQGKQYSVEQYFVGQFNCHLTSISASKSTLININNCVKDILSRLLVKSWGENTRNFLLDIQNILTDTDFKLHSSSAALKSKNEWIAQLDSEILQYQNKLAWNLRMLGAR